MMYFLFWELLLCTSKAEHVSLPHPVSPLWSKCRGSCCLLITLSGISMALHSFQSSFTAIMLFDPHNNPWGRQGRAPYPHFTDEKSRARRNGDLSQGNRTPQTRGDWSSTNLLMATLGLFLPNFTALPCSIWRTRDREAGDTWCWLCPVYEICVLSESLWMQFWRLC